ncbi:unnamed protein product, partial [marine sediment metagenome]
IMNIITTRSYRRQGIARQLMKTMLRWLQQSQIPVAKLYATPMAHSLYEELGFTKSDELKLHLD